MNSDGMVPPSTSNGSASSSDTNITVGQPSNDTMRPLQLGESCAYEAANRLSGCREPRSCASCLEILGCMVNSMGQCVITDTSSYDSTLDYRRAIALGYALPDGDTSAWAMRYSQSWHFRSDAAKYCDAADSVCAQCTAMNFWRRYSTMPDSRFCVGTDGCVCVDICERQWFVESDCPAGSSPTVTMPSYWQNSDQAFGERLWRGVLGFFAFMGIVVLVLWRRQRLSERATRARAQERQQRREARRQRRMNTRSSQLGVNTLNLSGWETYRRDLIDKEQARLSERPAPNDTAAVDADDNDSSSSSDDEETLQVDVVSTAYTPMEDQNSTSSQAPTAHLPPVAPPRLPPLSRSGA